MSDARDRMIAALKEVVVPALQSAGFLGSFPHFRRERPDQLDLLAFQFSKWGGAFVVEVGYCPATGYVTPDGKSVPPGAARVHHQHYRHRLRLGVRPPPNDRDHWFSFEPETPGVYREAAVAVLPLLRSQAEPWWRSHEHVEPDGA